MSLLIFFRSLVPGTWSTKDKVEADWTTKPRKLTPHFLVFQNGDYMELQNGDLLKTSDGAFDWSNKTRILSG